MLSTHDIVFQQSYTMQLVGEHIYRFMENYEEILYNTMHLILDNISQSKTKQTPESVDILFEGYTQLFQRLYFINSSMISMDKLDEDTINKVAQACREYGELYRIHFEKDAPPKIHLLEVHLVRKLRMFLRVGPNREDPIEHEHQVQNRERIKASNIRNHSQMQQVMDLRIGAKSIPAVAANVASMTTNRKFSIKTLEKKSERDLARKSIKKQKIEKWENLDDA